MSFTRFGMSFKAAVFRAKTSSVRRPAGRLHSELCRNQHLPVEQLRELTRRRAAQLATFAAQQTTFYGRLFAQHDVDVATLADPDAWERLPIIDRATVKAHADEFHTAARERHRREALTGGSTGEPMRMAHDARVPTLALAWRMYSWWGVAPWDDLARVGRWGFGRFDTVKNIALWWPTRQIYTDAAMINSDSLAVLRKSIIAVRPALIEGYVGAMLEFAEYLRRNGLGIPAPQAVATTAAPLTEDARARLQQALGAPVYDEYRGTEAGFMAGECREQNGLHVFSDMRLIEVVDPNGRPCAPGEVGDVVVTDLTNRVFPLVRYRLGDRGTLVDRPCACGVTLPLMAKPDGRTVDVLRLPSGVAMNHRLSAMFSRHPEAVRLFQIHQFADYSITVKVVAGEAGDAHTHIEDAVQALRERIHHEVRVTIEYVDSLPYNRGKTKYVISEVPATEADFA